ncbi:TIGR01212 family radical SAM protein [Desulforhopalus sp. IMCC35007]|uniref:TIGR01212 family radical SAM protein n=1 Tax=Desulforhopalus sp. IMCC35007 TaxID=2569543 RepID=UPI0010ADD84D|nr:TIGR01212 family radical SAM protein [Desulforhopalus sp. IMCC35007]TKB05824.1 TIGR01212 family radical SAM protein [Desulforhopalus sp. IMCC35007]
MNQLMRTFSSVCRARYGQAVGKVPVDIGRICPNRSKGGCIFCRPASFTPLYLESTDAVIIQVEKAKEAMLRGRFKKYFAYFQQETCTAAPVDELLRLASLLLHDDSCVGLILSTRPDAVAAELLAPLSELIKASGKDCLFELGVQTVHEQGLQLLNRNHSYADFAKAVTRIQQYGCFEVGAHLIFGIPGERRSDMLESVRTVCALGIDALKLHHLQVIQETPLEKLYLAGGVELFSLDSYLSFLLEVIVIIPETVTLHRLWATSHPDLLVAPKWNVLASELSKKLSEMMNQQGLWQGKALAESL